MNKSKVFPFKVLFFILFLAILALAQSEEFFVSYENGNKMNLSLPCANGVGAGCDNDFTCNFTMENPDGSLLYDNANTSYVRDGKWMIEIPAQTTNGDYYCQYFCYNSSSTRTTYSECTIRVKPELLINRLLRLPSMIWDAVLGSGMSANDTITDIWRNTSVTSSIVSNYTQEYGTTPASQSRRLTLSQEEEILDNYGGVNFAVAKVYLTLRDIVVAVFESPLLMIILISAVLVGIYYKLKRKRKKYEAKVE